MDQADIDRLWLEMQQARKKWTDASAEFDRSTKLFADLLGSPDGTLLLKKAREAYSESLRQYTAAAKLYTEALRRFVDHALHLAPRGDLRGVHMSVDEFMRSLADHQGNRAIGVVLSGSGTDGTLGLAEIQAQGGVTFAQEESSARYDGMPHSAISAGFVDYILPPKGIALELARIARHPYVSREGLSEPGNLQLDEHTSLNSIFQLLRRSTGVDFTHYRKTTIYRRIQRRMMVHKIDRLRDYVKYLQTNPAEINALYQDMLINVTSFFRNPKVFDALKSEVLPAIAKHRGADTNIRIWTPGCASGEETYSVAMALLEYLGDGANHPTIQIFGTDISEINIGKARAGVYPENIQTDVSPERLRRFFTKVENGYRISKSIREMCIFAQHNLINDPPFSQMDLICCRNLLIYLEPILQNKIISLLHYAIRGSGYLVLESSEGVGGASNLFTTVDRRLKIFSKKASAGRQMVSFSLNQLPEHSDILPSRIPAKLTDPAAWNYIEAQKEFDRRLLNHFSPASVFINDDLEVVHTRGNINRYLKLAPGRASLNILKMAREGLLFDLRNAINRARKEKTAVYKRHVEVRVGNGNGNGNGEGHGETKPAEARPRGMSRLVDFEVIPVTVGNVKDLYLMIVFRDVSMAPARPSRGSKPGKESESASRQVGKLQQELDATKELLQSVIETQEATNEELQSANEEILSSNEELQSTNEELETAKEELQSTNEELSTVNDELRTRNNEITHINNDLTNLLASIDIAMVMVGSDLTIRRFTPQAQHLLGLIPTDVGRPLWNINPSMEIPNFQQMVLQVISTIRPVERDLPRNDGTRYQLRILPYRTAEDKIDGAVITFVDISGNGNRS